MGISTSSGGKGSGRRKSQVPQDVIDTNWDNIFKKKPKPEPMNQTETKPEAPK